MKTKIVYVLVSSEKDYYLEQAYVSMYSLRQHNPKAQICLVADTDTVEGIRNNEVRGRLATYVDEFVSVDFPEHVSMKERSRALKTSLRKHVSGTFLFVDTDTVICGDLSEIDGWQFDLGIVLDLHSHLNRHPYGKGIKATIKKMYNVEVPDGIDYYNSGVMFVKDNEKTHDFFQRWHENWQKTKDLPGGFRDQQSLIKTEIDLNGFIYPMSGDYNCQILGSIQYLHTGKILHFFNTQWNGEKLSPLFEPSFYYRFKDTGMMDDESAAIIDNCKSSFVSPSMPIGIKDMEMWSSLEFNLLRKINERPMLESILNVSVRGISYVRHHLMGGVNRDSQVVVLQLFNEERRAA